MASLYKKRNKYHIAYHISGKRETICTKLDFTDANKAKAESIKKEIQKIENENKLKIKYGAIVLKNKNPELILSDALALYLRTIKRPTENGKQNNHSRNFEVVSRQFLKSVKAEIDVTQISKSDISNFVGRIEIKVANATLHTYVRYLKGFFNYLVEEEYIEKSPITKRVIPKVTSKPIITFADKDIKKILEYAKSLNTEYFIIYKFLLLTGIRPGDIFGICAGDFDFQKKILRLKISKTSRAIDFPIYKDLMKFINTYLSRIKSLDQEDRIFQKYNVDRIGKTFRKILFELELKYKKYNLKTFRKTFATSFADKGLTEGDLADLLGHSTTATTRAFYKSKNANAIRNRIEALGK